MKADQFRVLRPGIADVLMERLRAKVLVGTKLALASCPRIRLPLVRR